MDRPDRGNRYIKQIFLEIPCFARWPSFVPNLRDYESKAFSPEQLSRFLANFSTFPFVRTNRHERKFVTNLEKRNDRNFLSSETMRSGTCHRLKTRELKDDIWKRKFKLLFFSLLNISRKYLKNSFGWLKKRMY